MGIENCVDFEAMVLVAMAKADKRLLQVETDTAVTALDKSPQPPEMDPSLRFVQALESDQHANVLEILGETCADLSLDEKLDLMRNCWRVAISDNELHPSEETLIYDIVDELKVSRRSFLSDQQRLAG